LLAFDNQFAVAIAWANSLQNDIPTSLYFNAHQDFTLTFTPALVILCIAAFLTLHGAYPFVNLFLLLFLDLFADVLLLPSFFSYILGEFINLLASQQGIIRPVYI